MHYLRTLITWRLLVCGCLLTWNLGLHANEHDFPDFNKYFTELQKNRVTYNQYNDSIFKIDDHDEWIEFFRRKAAKTHEIYDENKRILNSITNYFSQNKEKINVVAYDSLYTACLNYVKQESSDPFLTEYMADILLKYYQGGNCPDSINHVMNVTSWKANAYYSIYNIGYDKDALRQSYELFRSIHNMPHKERFPDYETIYFNSIRQMVYTTWFLNGLMTKQELYTFADQLKELVKSLDKVDGKETIRRTQLQLTTFDETLLRNIYLVDSTFFEKEYADSLMRVVIAKNQKSKQVTFKSFIRTLILQMKLGELTPKQAFRIAQARYNREQAKLKDLQFTDYTLATFLGQYNNLVYLNDISGEPYTQRRQVALGYCKDIVTAYSRRLSQQNETKYIRLLYALVASPRLIKYLTEKERIKFMTALMVNVQVPTYAHSRHVGELAEIIMQGVLDNHPELLVGTLGYNTKKQVKKHKKEYMEFIRNAAQYHDLGKNTIAPVVTNDYRPLTDHEFNIIKQHPAMGLYYLNIAPSLSIYHDTTLGHHKWYNGKGGYPANFDNTQSPLRIMIDIITISDCMQAATERLGRNYKREISFPDLVAELKRDAGTRYNPDLVSLIAEHQDVASKLETSVRTGWFEIYYKIYNQYFKK